MQTDPIFYEDQMNMYAYVGNDPLNYSDPSGKYLDKINKAHKAYKAYKKQKKLEKQPRRLRKLRRQQKMPKELGIQKTTYLHETHQGKFMANSLSQRI